MIVPDQRGYNLSDKPEDLGAYSILELALDVLAIADTLGQRQFRVAGHDWGAAVAWALALRWPERITRLTILNVPHPLVMMQHLRHDFGQLLRSWYMLFFQAPILPEALFGMAGRQMLLNTSRTGTFSDEELAVYERSWNQPGCATGMINWYRSLLRTRPPKIDDPLVRVPATIVWGSKDRFLKREMAAESQDLCTNAKLFYLENATHWVQHEEPEQVNALLLA